MTMFRREQNGSATIEATISLVVFVFVIMAIYLLVNFCVTQARVSYAIDTAAKEMSQYSYFYHALGVQDVKEGLADKAGSAVSAYTSFNSLINGSVETAKEVGADPEGYLTSLVKGDKTDDLNELYGKINEASNVMSEALDNPVEFMSSIAALAGETAWDEATSHLIAAPVAKGMTQRHFGETRQEANAYLERMGVVGGLDGMNFNESTIFTGTSEKIEVVVYYKLSIKQIIPLLDNEVLMCQKAITNGWLGGDAS